MTSLDQRLLIIGGTGQIGEALRERVGKEFAVSTSRRDDIAGEFRLNLEDVAEKPVLADELFRLVKPSAVCIAAGMTWVDGCEDEPGLAYAINRDGAAAIAAAAHRHQAQCVYYSTEYIFDGTEGPYGELDNPNPVNVYGKSKLEGERAVLHAAPDALVLRTTVVFGPEEQGKNFAYQITAGVNEGRTLKMPRDQISSPTYNRDCADATIRLLDRGAGGIYHVTGPDVLSRYELALRIVRASGLSEQAIQSVDTSALRQRAIRPLMCGMKIEKLRRTLPDWQPRSVEAAIQHWLDHPRGKPWPA